MKETMKKRQELKVSTASENGVFGRNIFNIVRQINSANLNMATPENYRLGPGGRRGDCRRGGQPEYHAAGGFARRLREHRQSGSGIPEQQPSMPASC